MTYVELSGDRSLIPLNFKNRDHRLLLFDLAVEHKRHLLNDVDHDIVAIIDGYEQQEAAGRCFPFIALVDNTPAGCFWLEVDHYGIGRPRGALFSRFKSSWASLCFIQWIVDLGFQIVGLRKLECELCLYSKRDRESAAAERILKRIGFKKRAILPEAITVGGFPKDTILLDYLKRDYDLVQEKQQA